MVVFNSYNHFKNYCLKIVSNKGIEVTKSHHKAFENFEKVIELLKQLKSDCKINFKEDPLKKIVNDYKKDRIDEAIRIMDYLSKRIDAFEAGEIDIYYVFTALSTILGVNVTFTEQFISPKNVNDKYFPSKIRALKVLTSEDRIYSITTEGLDYNVVYGVYFIYDKDGNIGYIGKSSNNAVTRSFASAAERGLIDFSKIEIRETKSKSDVAIYEAYFISKYKPRYNSDLVYDDSTTLTLPELKVVKKFKRSKKDYFNYSYTYYKSTVAEVQNILSSIGKRFFIDSEENRELLEREGVFDKYTMKSKAYEECIVEIKQKGYMAVSEVKWYFIEDEK